LASNDHVHKTSTSSQKNKLVWGFKQFYRPSIPKNSEKRPELRER